MTFYRKQGKRYYPVAEFPFNPLPGIWIVTEDSKQHIFRIGEILDVPSAMIIAKHRELISRVIVDNRESSAADIAKKIVVAIGRVESMGVL